MRSTMRTLLWAVGLSIATIACGKKGAERQREPAQKAREGVKGEKEDDEKAAGAKKETGASAAKVSTETKTTLQKDVDGSDRKTTYPKKKLAKARGATKKNAEAASG